MMKRVGDTITVRASDILGTPEAEGVIREIYTNRDGSHHYGVKIEGEDGLCDVDLDGTVLIGPPLDGRLVRAE